MSLLRWLSNSKSKVGSQLQSVSSSGNLPMSSTPSTIQMRSIDVNIDVEESKLNRKSAGDSQHMHQRGVPRPKDLPVFFGYSAFKMSWWNR